jgi:hypothetical protein
VPGVLAVAVDRVVIVAVKAVVEGGVLLRCCRHPCRLGLGSWCAGCSRCSVAGVRHRSGLVVVVLGVVLHDAPLMRIGLMRIAACPWRNVRVTGPG